ncbi:MAG TPA: NrfD/PsrC family molybdoenzyme membrane anchor subunit [Candidatus Saccharimonadales bacterium]|nr:NrfD/PsrC family molybdoenzyme membrane anchor subunit [Candidatus Saccharimonadales bacterium]
MTAEPLPGAAAGMPQRRRRGGGGRSGERLMVPPATFASYYGRPIVKAAPWELDIPAYLFLGGLAAGSSLLAAGADLTNRPELRRVARLGALAGGAAGTAALIHDLGKPMRFLNMMRTVKPTSPMSMGTWVLAAYGPLASLAAAAEVAAMLPRPVPIAGRLLALGARPAGVLAAALAPALASYTGVLLADTATPAWHAAWRELPLIFAGSAAASAGGLAMLGTGVAQAAPARRLAVGGAVLALTMEARMGRSMGLSAETLRTGKAKRLMDASRALTIGGALGTILFGSRIRGAARVSGAALLAGSVCTRFAIFEAGQQSALDPRYTVVPQRQRLEERAAAVADRP